MTGEDVKVLQTFLNFHLANAERSALEPGDYPLVVDGKFGERTDRVVRLFQKINGLLFVNGLPSPHGAPDGVVGPVTRRAVLDVRVLEFRGMFAPIQLWQTRFSDLKLTLPTLHSGEAAGAREPLKAPRFTGFNVSPAPYSAGASSPMGGWQFPPQPQPLGQSPSSPILTPPSPLRSPQWYTLTLSSGLQSFSNFSTPVSVPWVLGIKMMVPIPRNRLGLAGQGGINLYSWNFPSDSAPGGFYGGLAWAAISQAPTDWLSYYIGAGLYYGPKSPGGESDLHAQLLAQLNFAVPTPKLVTDLIGRKFTLGIGLKPSPFDIDLNKHTIQAPNLQFWTRPYSTVTIGVSGVF